MKRKLITLLTAAVLLTSVPEISQAAVTPVPIGKINMPVNFRSGPSTDSTVYSTLQPGTSIKVLSEVSPHWLRIKVGVKTGYVSATYVDYKPLTTGSTASSTSASKSSTSSSSGTSTANSSTGSKSTSSSSNTTVSSPALASSTTVTAAAPAINNDASANVSTNAPGTGIVEKGVNFRAEPNTTSSVLRVLTAGEAFSALEQPTAAWVKIQDKNGVTGYVSTDYVSYTLPASQTAILAEVPQQTVDQVEDKPFNPPAPAFNFPTLSTGQPLDEASADRILANALALQGITQYGYGKNEAPTLFDCSSFTRYVFGLEGIDLAWGTRYQKDVGIAVERGQWQKGDLLFFSAGDPNVITHVAIYAGDNKIVHNSPSLNGITISNLDLAYWQDHYVTARRVLR
ncbi:SH3 domain-containing protein [Paenibacillus hunanensis]|uniref:C40 family peptidase n=1 Tax=Paenibacillus hunanensis TaxID=539262 RepID=UPI002A6B58BB|nr:SH3 domain-containing protein [Paenibacillus hunanensis]WPP39553.1 SH3 domain-containing protein [Paenibacillus hunanensis]